MDNMLTVCCPVCTLYLREGVTLQDHLNTHPKEQVIEALVRYSAVGASKGSTSGEGPSKHFSTISYQQFLSHFSSVPVVPQMVLNPYPVYPQSEGGDQAQPHASHHHVQYLAPSPLIQTPSYILPTDPPPCEPSPLPLNPEEQSQVSTSTCGADSISCPHYPPTKEEVQLSTKIENPYEYPASESRDQEHGSRTMSPLAPEEPTNLCLRQSDNVCRESWAPHTEGHCFPAPVSGAENSRPYPLRHVVHHGQILRTGGGTIVEDGEGRTLLNLSEPGPMSVLELEGIHFLVPSQFIGNSSATNSAQEVKPVADGSASEKKAETCPPPNPIQHSSTPAAPDAPDVDADADPDPEEDADIDVGRRRSDSPIAVVDSAPCSPSPINIRSDETMPAHGEISEQESVGGNSSSMWPEQNFTSSKEQGGSMSYEIYNGLGCSPKFPPQSVSFSSSLPPSVRQAPTETEPQKKKPRIAKCRWCQMSFNSQAERRAHICEKKKDKEVQPSTSESGMQVQKPKRVYKKKQTKDNPVERQLDQFTDVLALKTNEVTERLTPDCPVVVEPIKSFKCEKCDEEFTSYRLMASHRGREHKGSRYECATCSETFELEAQYHTHLVVHPLECKLCGKFFYRRKNMALHMKRHMSVKPYKCDHCDKSFVTKQKLDEHSNIHTGAAPIKCPLCDETFRRHSNLVQHKNRHHFNVKQKKKDFICHCGEVYHTKKKLEWHKEIHEEKPKSCSFCNERFVHASSLTRHVRKAHDQRYVPKVGRESENVECPECHTVCLKSSLAVHMRTHSGARPYPCQICGKNFTTKWNLQLHRWTHASRSTKPFKCTMCKSAFYRRSDFTSHMRSHRNVRPYTCNFCGCQFIRKYNCIRHMNEHEKTKSYSCTLCDKTFHRSYYLKEHMRVHSKTRPYSCHICGKASSSKSNHNKHVKIHHAREPQNTEG